RLPVDARAHRPPGHAGARGDAKPRRPLPAAAALPPPPPDQRGRPLPVRRARGGNVRAAGPAAWAGGRPRADPDGVAGAAAPGRLPVAAGLRRGGRRAAGARSRRDDAPALAGGGRRRRGRRRRADEGAHGPLARTPAAARADRARGALLALPPPARVPRAHRLHDAPVPPAPAAAAVARPS